MIPNIGPLEIAIVLILALVVFGPKRLPSLGRSLGSGITQFRQGLSQPEQASESAPESSDAAESVEAPAEPLNRTVG